MNRAEIFSSSVKWWRCKHTISLMPSIGGKDEGLDSLALSRSLTLD
jgi:hypothetical protein